MKIKYNVGSQSIFFTIDNCHSSSIMNTIKKRFKKRSHLFVPATKIIHLNKMLEYNPDTVILDLEDSIPDKLKNNARNFLFNLDEIDNSTTEFIVRINSFSSNHYQKDLEALKKNSTKFHSISLAKTESANEIIRIKESFPHHCIYAFCETPLGVKNSFEIASSLSTSDFMGLGAGDISRCFGVERIPTYQSDLLKNIFINVALAAHNYNVGFIDTISRPYSTDNAISILEKEAKWSKETIGAVGKRAIHPSQVATINKIFTPSLALVEKNIDILNYFSKITKTQSIGKPGNIYSGKPELESALQNINNWLSNGIISITNKN